jgi:hypothetical protein
MHVGPDLYTTGTHWTYRDRHRRTVRRGCGKANLGHVTLAFSHMLGPNMKSSRDWHGNLHIIGGSRPRVATDLGVSQSGL